jgi:hypothetical protein
VEPEPQALEEPQPKPAVEPESPPAAPSKPAREYVASAAPAPSFASRLRAWLGDEEWEALVGGSVINKIGAVILVIGIALFVGYSFAHVGPAGRAATAILFSAALLLSGIWCEKRPRFKVFSRGLIGAGWAALYATAYAIYAVPEARIIQSPVTGSIGLLLVAVGMIGHSLKYRVQAVTGVAYFAAFAALALTPATPFAVLSLIPLAASVLYLVTRFNWYPMALFGAIATYATCLSKADPNATLAGTQALLLAYWLLFETFDLLRARRQALMGGVEWIFPLNAAGFLGISYLTWSAHAPERLWLASAWGAGLYLAGAIARVFVRPPQSFDSSTPLIARLRAGGFEGSVLISAVLAALAIFGHVPGVWMSFGLALEAETLYLAGVLLQSAFLRRLGASAFVTSLFRLGWTVNPRSHTTVLGHQFWNATPGALFHVFLFYVNRAIWKNAVPFSSFASAIAALVLVAETDLPYVGMSWLLFAIVLIEFGLWKKLLDFRIQGYILAGSGILVTAAQNVIGERQPWAPFAVILVPVYAAALQNRFFKSWIDDRERPIWGFGSAGATVLVSALLVWRTVPENLLGISWCGLTLVMLELGLRRLPPELRWSLIPMALATTFGTIATHTSDLAKFPPAVTWSTYLCASIAATAAAVRISWKRDEIPIEDAFARDLICFLGSAAATVLLWLVLPDRAVALAWTGVAIGMVELSRRYRMRVLALIAWLQLALAYERVWMLDLADGSLWGIPRRLLIAPLFIAALYWLRYRTASAGTTTTSRVLSWGAFWMLILLSWTQGADTGFAVWSAAVALSLYTRDALRSDLDSRLQAYAAGASSLIAALSFDVFRPRLAVSLPVVAMFYAARFISWRKRDERAPVAFNVSATFLLAAVLFGKVSGGMLTVAWGIEGLAILTAGFTLRDRIFRLQGLALFLVCTLKLFLYDLRNLETPYRIVSFIVLGLILLSVSWFYSRFREHVRRIL